MMDPTMAALRVDGLHLPSARCFIFRLESDQRWTSRCREISDSLEQIGLRTRNTAGVLAVLAVEGFTALIKRVYLFLTLGFIVVILLYTIYQFSAF